MKLKEAIYKLPFDKILTLKNVRNTINEADGYQPHIIAPEAGYRRLIEDGLSLLREPCACQPSDWCIQGLPCLQFPGVCSLCTCQGCDLCRASCALCNFLAAVFPSNQTPTSMRPQCSLCSRKGGGGDAPDPEVHCCGGDYRGSRAAAVRQPQERDHRARCCHARQVCRQHCCTLGICTISQGLLFFLVVLGV